VTYFRKTLGDSFDRIELRAERGSDWLTIEMHVGNDVETVRIELRSEEAAHDLHYGIGRYLAQLDQTKPRQ
jgi:hypothetical protein